MEKTNCDTVRFDRRTKLMLAAAGILGMGEAESAQDAVKKAIAIERAVNDAVADNKSR